MMNKKNDEKISNYNKRIFIINKTAFESLAEVKRFCDNHKNDEIYFSNNELANINNAVREL